MSEERTGPPPGETDDLDELLSDDEELETEEGEETEPEEGTETEPEPEQPQPQPQRVSRTEKRIQTLLRRDKERDEELKRLRDAVIARPQPAQQIDPARQAQLDREEAERVAQLPYDEQARYWNRKTEERVNQQLLRGQLETRDMLDRQNFQQIMRERRLPARYATEVDSLLAQARQQGLNPSREWLLKAAIGNEVLEKKDRETSRQRVRGQRRIASQTTRPSGTRSTAASPGRRGQDTDADLDARLKGITLGEYTSLYDR